MNCFKSEKNRPSKKHPLNFFYPSAVYTPHLSMLKTVYKWEGLPKYFIIHFTAGWQNQGGESFMKSFLKRGLCTYFMDQSGQIFQQHHGNTGGYHAGSTTWNGISSISKLAGGIEIACGGKLKKHEDGTHRTWFNKIVPEKNQRRIDESKYSNNGFVHSGVYEKYTKQQEESLKLFCKWLLDNGVEKILGHDDVAPNRKNDPGGALSLPLDQWLSKYVI